MVTLVYLHARTLIRVTCRKTATVVPSVRFKTQKGRFACSFELQDGQIARANHRGGRPPWERDQALLLDDRPPRATCAQLHGVHAQAANTADSGAVAFTPHEDDPPPGDSRQAATTSSCGDEERVKDVRSSGRFRPEEYAASSRAAEESRAARLSSMTARECRGVRTWHASTAVGVVRVSVSVPRDSYTVVQ